MQPFVLSGRASTVFGLIALKAKEEQAKQDCLDALAELRRIINYRPCPVDPKGLCGETRPCAETGCPVWEAKGKE